MERKVIVVSSLKSHVERRSPRIRLSGFWLNDIGFESDSLVSGNYENGSITFNLQGKGVETYSKIVKGLLKNRAGLLQVYSHYANKKLVPYLEVSGFWLNNFGFEIGSVIVVQYEYGVINIRVLDLEKFCVDSKRAISVSPHEIDTPHQKGGWS